MLLELLKRIHKQTVEISAGTTLNALIEITTAQKLPSAALDLTQPTMSDLVKPGLWSTVGLLFLMKSGTYAQKVWNLSCQSYFEGSEGK